MQKIKIGAYLIIGETGDYRVMEQFGAYRMLKKHFKTILQAEERIEQLVRA